MPTLGDENVGGFDVPMDDPRRMRRIERVGDLNGKRQEQIGFQWTSGDAVLQHYAIQILHGDEGLPIVLADVVDRADVGMVQCGCSLRFAPEAAQGLRVLGYFLRQELECDKTVKRVSSAL